MSVNTNIQFANMSMQPRFADLCLPSSIEDDIIAERLRAKQRRASSSSDSNIFAISLISIEPATDKRNSDLARANIIDFDFDCVEEIKERNSSFTTAGDSLRNSIESCQSQNRDFSILSNLEFDKTLGQSTVTANSSEKKEKSREVQQKLLLGLSALSATFNKVQEKDVAFKFAHLKIFAQLNALKNKKNEVPAKPSSRLRLPDRKTQFYRRVFENVRASQIIGGAESTDSHHTLALKA